MWLERFFELGLVWNRVIKLDRFSLLFRLELLLFVRGDFFVVIIKWRVLGSLLFVVDIEGIRVVVGFGFTFFWYCFLLLFFERYFGELFFLNYVDMSLWW